MPLIKLHIYRGSRTADEVDRLLDTVHAAMLHAFRVPERDRYQILFEHEDTHLIAQDTGLGFARSGRFVMIEVISRPRSRTDKLAFYQGLAERLYADCGVESSDVMVSIVENRDEDWSFGAGEAQFVTGVL
ncbi:tautomerase family protein [Rhizobium sp. CC-YZS058]|uniref:tautomerase family protein n=1 Tax=Rhizobium sp. CC-YZS058 TaxID=3042153 RepID=UPI002B060EA4|nr:tautomerase family protein [Rhizobium sp. CC-YZS058]MEA3537052.1 tautomerase family protein [Rhizobium sp. CC-YZS058]